jgi:hypothetical protein
MMPGLPGLDESNRKEKPKMMSNTSEIVKPRSLNTNVDKLVEQARSIAVEYDVGDPVAVSDLLLRAAIKSLSDDVADMRADGLDCEMTEIFQSLYRAIMRMKQAQVFLDSVIDETEKL